MQRLTPYQGVSPVHRRALLLLVLIAAAVGLAGCPKGLPGPDAGVALDSPEKMLGAVETRITAAARATTRASRRGSLSLPELLVIRHRIENATEVADDARALLAAGEGNAAISQIGLAQSVLTVIERRLEEASQ